MCQGSSVVYVPAVAVLGRLGVDQDETLAVGVGWQSGAAVPLRGRATAWMKLDNAMSGRPD